MWGCDKLSLFGRLGDGFGDGFGNGFGNGFGDGVDDGVDDGLCDIDMANDICLINCSSGAVFYGRTTDRVDEKEKNMRQRNI